MSTFDNATLMITGGTGSFGSTVLKHFLDSDLKEIRIFSRDEKKQDDMRHELQAKHNQINSFIQIHQETCHTRISNSNRIACFNLINKQRNHASTATHNVTITSTADCGTTTFRS